MNSPRIVHVIPRAGGRWELRWDGVLAVITYMDLGQALDAATLACEPDRSARVVVHAMLESKAS